MGRPKGTGSKREARPGVWEVRYAGKSRTIRGGPKDAEKALRDLIERNSGTQARPAATLDDLLREWLPQCGLARRTVEGYGNVLRLHLPADHRLRRTKVNQLLLRDFDQLYAELGRKGTGAQTIIKLHTALSSALTEAVRWNWISHNPAHRARLPKVPQSVGDAVPDDALEKILAVVDGRDLQCQVWIHLALATGQRPGEILALQWSRVDLERGVIRVQFGTEVDETLKETKTGKVRTVSIDGQLVALLRRWRAGQTERAFGAGVPLAADPYVLSNAADSSTPWKARAVGQRFARLCKTAGVSGVRPYDLRHTHATMLLEAGVHVNAVAERIGNDPAVTLRVYGHARADVDREAAELAAARVRRVRSS